jgi:hypothetical protein
MKSAFPESYRDRGAKLAEPAVNGYMNARILPENTGF